jgi:hypothetical protein
MCYTNGDTYQGEWKENTYFGQGTKQYAGCSMQMEVVMKGVGKTAWQTGKGFTLIQAGADTMANGIAARGMAKWPFSLRWWPIQPTGVNESCAVGPEA